MAELIINKHRQVSDIPRGPRSAGANLGRRDPLPWPTNEPFRILAIDGGGIRGIYPASFLSLIETELLDGDTVADYFDLVAGTSTGGIIALGLASGLTASQIADAYINRGGEIFPPLARLRNRFTQWFFTGYKTKPLVDLLHELLGDRKLGAASTRVCIPSAEGKHGEPYIFKTRHHADYKLDHKAKMLDIALATCAAPSYFKAIARDHFTLLDGGVWANNPVMVGLVDALACFDVVRENVRILSIGCCDTEYTSKVKLNRFFSGKFFAYRYTELLFNLMSLNALGQAGLLIGQQNITRINQYLNPGIALDDWTTAKTILPNFSRNAFDLHGPKIAEIFLKKKARPFVPVTV